MANTTSNTPTGDATVANIAADSATGTAKANPTAAEKAQTPEVVQEETREPGDLWTSKPTVPESEQVDENAAARAAEEEQARRENPNEVVYRAADEG